MTEHTFLFVTCVNDEGLYETCVKHIAKLLTPLHSSIQLFPIRGAKSMTAGYNFALSHPAKYKIYLHQDTFILNRNFLNNILHLFQAHARLGLIGMIGCKRLPSSGIWWEDKNVIGKVLSYQNDTYHLIKKKESDAPFEQVETVDGLLMATQYDLRWREDLFTGFHFYDTSQSTEFMQHGYLVGVPKQIEPWCLHFDITDYDNEEYQVQQTIFRDHYITAEKN
jgi:hypothetical protein